MIAVAFKMLLGFIFDNPIGKAVAGGLGILAVASVWLWQHDNKVESATRVEITKEAEKAGAKAEVSRRGADVGDPVERLLKGRCRDC